MRIPTAAAAAALLAGCMMEPAPLSRQESHRWALEQAQPVGEPVDCIALPAIRHSVARDDRTIDFAMGDGRLMRNRLPQACPGLAFEDRFLYRTSLARLCSVDVITVLLPDGTRGPSCGLGRFQEVRLPPR